MFLGLWLHFRISEELSNTSKPRVHSNYNLRSWSAYSMFFKILKWFTLWSPGWRIIIVEAHGYYPRSIFIIQGLWFEHMGCILSICTVWTLDIILELIRTFNLGALGQKTREFWGTTHQFVFSTVQFWCTLKLVLGGSVELITCAF